jgi:lipopolysaccharide transport system permease protein
MIERPACLTLPPAGPTVERVSSPRVAAELLRRRPTPGRITVAVVEPMIPPPREDEAPVRRGGNPPPDTAWADWWAGTRRVDLWGTLAWYDIVLRYRRSMLGPWWITLSMGALLVGMGPLYAALFSEPLARFYPHLALGIIFWNFFSTSINDGCQVYIAATAYLKQGSVPRSVFVWRSVVRQLLFLLHHLILYLPVAIWAGLRWNPRMLLVLPGLLVVLVNLHALAITLGFLSARFRDVPNIVASSLQMLMFLTPVFWFPDKLPERAKFILYNPLAQLLDVVRLPLLGGLPAPGTVWFLAYFTALNLVIAAGLYATCRRRVVYWV